MSVKSSNKRLFEILEYWSTWNLAKHKGIVESAGDQAAREVAQLAKVEIDLLRGLLMRSWFKSAKSEPSLQAEVMQYFDGLSTEISAFLAPEEIKTTSATLLLRAHWEKLGAELPDVYEYLRLVTVSEGCPFQWPGMRLHQKG